MSPNHHDWERADIYQEENAKLRAEIERLQADVAELSRVLNGIANRSDFADKVLEARRALEQKP